MTIHRVEPTPADRVQVGDEVLRRSTAPSTGRMGVDTVTKVNVAPLSQQDDNGSKLQFTWNDNKKNLSYAYPQDEVLVVRRSRWGR